MIKVIFFDIDGTLLSHTLHEVPKSAREALRKLKQKGIKCVAATGRHLSELEKLPIKDIEFDGYITLNGQLCLDENKKIYFDRPIAGADRESLIRLFAQKAFPVALVERDGMYISYVNQEVERAQAEISSEIPSIGCYTGNEIYQGIAYLDKQMDADLSRRLPDCSITRWNEIAVDIIPRRGGKTAGIEEYLKRNGIDRAETMAFGDGKNDIEMLRFAGIGVAMGNADASVKAAADYVTEHVDHDGIELALKHWKFID